jgi:hypothetical protein
MGTMKEGYRFAKEYFRAAIYILSNWDGMNRIAESNVLKE